jgi:hypothetical protein
MFVNIYFMATVWTDHLAIFSTDLENDINLINGLSGIKLFHNLRTKKNETKFVITRGDCVINRRRITLISNVFINSNSMFRPEEFRLNYRRKNIPFFFVVVELFFAFFFRSFPMFFPWDAQRRTWNEHLCGKPLTGLWYNDKKLYHVCNTMRPLSISRVF